jgi:hypothetical protein
MSMTVIVYAVPTADADRLTNDPDLSAEFTRYGNPTAVSVSLEKSWHGLHYLLTGDAWESAGPKAFLIAGGRETPESDAGYGPARLFSPSETADINAAISPVSGDELWGRFDSQEMASQDIYPMIWDESEADLKEEYLFCFHDLKKLIANAAATGQGLLVVLA